MKPKEAAALIGVIGLVWHFLSAVRDADRYEANLAQWRAVPTGRNLVRLLLAEGILIDDIATF